MLESIQEFFRARRRQKTALWRSEVISRILVNVLPSGTPYIYQAVLSFLQPGGLNFQAPNKLDLFFQEYPLAIDLLGPEHSPHYKDAAPYISFEKWKELQTSLSLKKKLLSDYRCPYLTLDWDEPSDISSLSERIRILIGRYPR